MEVTVNMYKGDGIEVDGCVLRSRKAAEYLAAWILAQCDVIWPKENEDDALKDLGAAGGTRR